MQDFRRLDFWLLFGFLLISLHRLCHNVFIVPQLGIWLGNIHESFLRQKLLLKQEALYFHNSWKRTIFYSVLFLLLLIHFSYSMADAENRAKVWTSLDISGPLKAGSKWNYDFFTEPRFANNKMKLEQVVFRPSIFYEFNKNWSIWAGYDLIPIIPRDETNIIWEQRVWQQVEYDKAVSHHLVLGSRSRFEYRSISNRGENSTRFRQRFELAITKTNRFNIDYDIYDEIFVRLKPANWVPDERLNQNRIFLGLAIPVSQKMEFNVGYLNIFRPRQERNQIDHVLSLSMALNTGDEKPLFPERAI